MKRAILLTILLLVLVVPALGIQNADGSVNSQIWADRGNGTTEAIYWGGTNAMIVIIGTPVFDSASVTLQWSYDHVSFINTSVAALNEATTGVSNLEIVACRCYWRVFIQGGSGSESITVVMHATGKG